MEQFDTEFFSDKNEVKSQFLKWGKPGDWFKGTLTDIREIRSQLPGQEGKMTKVYDFVMNSGSFHNIDEKKNPVADATVISKGDRWTIGGKAGIDNQMRNAKIGQIIGMRFVEEKASKTKGFNPQKVIKVYIGGMDPEFQGNMPGDEIDPSSLPL